LYISNWGGRHPKAGEKTAPSSGTPVLIDDRGIAKSGTVGNVDLATGRMIIESATGFHPSDLAYDAKAGRIYVANANSDTVTILDMEMRVVEQVGVRPDSTLLFGSGSNALALSEDGRSLYVANGGNNALALVDLGDEAQAGKRVRGFIPTAWFPGAVTARGDTLFVANVKGLGSRGQTDDEAAAKGRDVHHFLGTVSIVPKPDTGALEAMTRQVVEDGRIPHMLRAWERGQRDVASVPVPKRLGEPSVFEHVVYVIKENRTYDQVFGDLPQGNGDPALCVFGRDVSPNHHALAEEFVLLDNFYCNGVNSADGHAWSTEGYVTDHLEKSFGGFTRSYTFGDDPLTYSSSGFIWDNVLLHGHSFRNYGEMDYAEPVPAGATFVEILCDFEQKTGRIAFTHKVGIENLWQYTHPTYPGWNMAIPDVVRAQIFLDELVEAEKTGEWPDFQIVFLPQDHGSGTTPDMPTPRAHMADNDLALGRIIDGISHSRFWPRTCVFVIEDDPQDGFDHVDGHRSIALVVSPYTKRRAVVSHFYNQTSVLHTMERILGCPPMNQMDAQSPLMTACFVDAPDLTTYVARPNTSALDELNPKLSALRDRERFWARKSLEQNFREFDRADADTLNRIIWHSVKGVDTPYPAEMAGAHGKGLKALGLRIDRTAAPDDDDD
jgi:hypothetical protein